MVRTLQLLLMTVMLGLLCPGALADGKAFTLAARQPTMPDQRAMIVWDGSVETLLIDTTIEGADGAAAWVVPVPGAPEVLEVEAGLFPTLQVVMQPRLLDSRNGAAAAVILCWMALIILGAAAARSRGGHGCFALSLVLVLGVLGVGLLMPALGTPRGLGPVTAPGDASVVVSRERVGLYEVAVLQSDEAGGIVEWLDAAGFQVDSAAREAIAEYAAEGWYFVASKLAPLSGGGASAIAPHPLGLRFAATKAVYPMRLTGTQNRDLRVDLFVFGEQMAGADGFAVERCAELEWLPREGVDVQGWRQPVRPRYRPSESIALGQPQLRALLVGNATTATWLAATLTPGDMARDVTLSWVEPRLQGNTVISRRYAAARAWKTWAGALLLGSVVIFFCWGEETPRRRVSRIAVAVLLVAPTAAGVGVFLTDRGVRTRSTESPMSVMMSHQFVGDELLCLLFERGDADPAWERELTPAQAEQFAREQWPEAARRAYPRQADPWQNAILGIPMREAAEPGGYRIWHDEVGVWYAYYDLAGQETAARIWSLPDPAANQIPDEPGG
jgi:hypothetical protein